MKRTILVAVWGALMIGLWLVLVMDPRPRADARPASSATDALETDEEPVEAPELQPSPAPRAPIAQPVAQAPAKLPPAPPAAPAAPLNDADPPTPSETDGKLAALYDAWTAQQTDSALTSAVVSKVEMDLRNNDITPLDHSIKCNATICRTRFTFPDLDAMRRLAKLPQNDKIDLITGDPEPTPTGLSIIIYFAPEGQKLPKAPG